MYSHILVAVDLSEEGRQVLAKAKAIAAVNVNNEAPSKISIIHVLEPITFAYGGDIPLDVNDIQNQMSDHARSHLEEIVTDAGLPVSTINIQVGRPAGEVHQFAQDNQVDIIVIGSHGRHGLKLLLGSTANAVLHGAKCDVLAVRVDK